MDLKYWKSNRFSMKKFQINLRKHWFTDVKPISKNRDKKSFLLKFKDFIMEIKGYWIPENFELTFPVFFHHNLKEMYHLVRVIVLKSLQFSNLEQIQEKVKNLRKHWFTDVKSISKKTWQKVFPFEIRIFHVGNEETLNS